MRIPRHLAIIMDGNGRWAEERRMPRIAGHQKGVEAVREVVAASHELGISYLTLYAFSSENWGRPETEVNALMQLLARYLASEVGTMHSRRIRFNVIGDAGRLPAEIRSVLRETMESTARHDGMVLTLALSYGARDELVRSMRKLAGEVASGALEPEAIDEELIASSLDTGGLPDPDLLVRTSGEMRVSNFLLWQLAYCELYFTGVLWPDFDRQQLHNALSEYGSRKRRFGLTSEQVDGEGENPGEARH